MAETDPNLEKECTAEMEPHCKKKKDDPLERGRLAAMGSPD
jgi:hypothetical protein